MLKKNIQNNNNSNNHVQPTTKQSNIPNEPLDFSDDVAIKSAKRYIQLHGNTLKKAFMAAACEGNTNQFNGLCLIEDFDINCTDSHENTALHYAVLHNRTEMVQVLLDNHAIHDKKNKWGYTPMAIAETLSPYRNMTIIKMLEFTQISMNLNELPDEDFEFYSTHNSQTDDQDDSIAEPSFKKITLAIDKKTLKIEKMTCSFDNLDLDEKPSLSVTEAPIIKAINDDDHDRAHELMNADCDLDIKDSVGYTPLMLAIGKAQMSIVKKIIHTLVKKYAKDPEGKQKIAAYINNSHDGASALLIAATNMPDIVPFLINHQADVNIVDEFGFSPLHMAIAKGHINAVLHLLRSGALANIHDINGNTLLHLATKDNRMEIIQELAQSKTAQCDINAVNNEGKTALILAAEYGHHELCGYFIQHHADVNSANNAGLTALHYAVANDAHIILDHLLASKGMIDINKQSNVGSTPLALAIHTGKAITTRKLVLAGADVNIAGYVGITPLHSASSRGDCDVAQFLLDHGADPFATDLGGITAKQHACGNQNMIDLLERAELLMRQPRYLVHNELVNEKAMMQLVSTFDKEEKDQIDDKVKKKKKKRK